MGSKSYGFKPSNWNLPEYLSSRQFQSKQLRADAEKMKIRADAIDDELAELQKQLEEVQHAQ